MPAYRDGKTGNWYAQFRVKEWNGEVRAVKKRGFPTKREALAYEQKYKVVLNGTSDMTFGEYAEVYLRDMSPRIKASTLETKERILFHKIVPFFRNKKLREISTSDVLQWQNKMMSPQENGQLAASYLKTLHNQLSAMLNHAVKYYGIPKNVAQIVGNMGHEKDVKIDFWTLEEYKTFIQTQRSQPEFYFAFELLYWTGIREGELLALTLSDFDFEKNTLQISKTYHRSKKQDIITSPKTSRSNRTIKIPDALAKELKIYFSMMYHPYPSARIFDLSRDRLYHAMSVGCKMAGVKRIRIHDLRHSHVSLLINMGFSAVAIADRVGHESSEITYRYAHLFPSTQDKMAEQLNALKGE